MLAQAMTHGAYAHPAWGNGPGPWTPGWWLIFPVLFWLLVLLLVGYLIHRGSPAPSARRAAQRVLAELYARGEISDDELKHRRAVLRSKS